MTVTYTGWWQVPAQLLTKTALAELDFPRTCEGRVPDAFVEGTNWRGRKDVFALFDVHACTPTSSTATQLDAAQRRRMKSRACQDCGAHCQAPLTTVGENPVPARLCPACRHIELLRCEQSRIGWCRALVTADVAALFTGPPAVVMQLALHEPPRTERGSRRPVTAVRAQVAGLDGTVLLDVVIRLAGPRAKWVPDGAVDKAEGVARLREAIGGKRLVVWSADELTELRKLDPTGDHPNWMSADPWITPRTPDRDNERITTTRSQSRAVHAEVAATQWRGEIDQQTRRLVRCLAPGTADRLALLLRRIAATDGNQPQLARVETD
ncbi:hypothetical protein [Amycolatopsis sp. H20-H5]|uniref:hypothetical protein n=1 Tax=Amycolatopsis sp. H20-H5 TaxID=3046309 RepID=UPI002DBF4B41|nr:hypothetical protein [Amycolatopsis sp. H20-H5]MEC3976257.1 hypothetical protein [Amycolatopsis sp. H20-H5]